MGGGLGPGYESSAYRKIQSTNKENGSSKLAVKSREKHKEKPGRRIQDGGREFTLKRNKDPTMAGAAPSDPQSPR
ncbi:hypothetical protein NDU88_001384 [Pleurodeles waltl]|uniref:Uncharacterized protein n=1 Tax=Pleurodeles waltl TaxID=8319 RepID=A0AAV7TI63_PLEWA|nr:hypothetical protein NDU88_001384 [Pleurodeles waltl]